MKLFTLLAIGMYLFGSWNTASENPLKKSEWLIGTWENKSLGNMYETWVKINEQEFFGKSYVLKKKDTMIFETIRLLQQNNTVFYIPTVKDQNDGLPVRFASKTISDTELVFENPSHDFPQVISYKRINADSLVAEISGTRNGKVRSQIFPMKRVK